MVELQQDLKDFVGSEYVNDRVDFKLNNRSEITTVIEKMSKVKTAGGFDLTKTDTKDGIKIYLGENSWVLARPSGTEPLLRIYFESNNIENLEKIKKDILSFIK